MRVDDETKLKVIFTISNLKKNFIGTIYASELRGLRRKYIYKDISFDELKRDVNWLNDLIKIKNYEKA
jgi:predicted transcriptional regulator